MSAGAFGYGAPDNRPVVFKAVVFSVIVHVGMIIGASFQITASFKDRFAGPIQMIDIAPLPGSKLGARPSAGTPSEVRTPPVPRVREPQPTPKLAVKKPPVPVLPKPVPKPPPNTVVLGTKPPAAKPLPKPDYTEADFEERMRRLRQAVPDKEARPEKHARTEADVRQSIDRMRAKIGDPEERASDRRPAGQTGTNAGPGVVGTGSLGSAVADMRFAAYRSILWSHVKEYWNLPPSLSGRGLSVVLVANVSRNGVITKYWIEESSGVDTFDQSAIRALLNASPLPKVPDDVPDQAFRDGFGFRFSE